MEVRQDGGTYYSGLRDSDAQISYLPQETRIMRAFNEIRQLDKIRVQGTPEERRAKNRPAIEAIFRKYNLNPRDYGL